MVGSRASVVSNAGSGSAIRKDVTKKPLLLELFTSEGCSSCPPAEVLLSKYDSEQPFGGAEVVTLAFHVDYWDDLGWKDPFASPLFTQRQQIYDRKFRTGEIYTPQMVIDGDIQFIGSREKDAKKAVTAALKQKKGNLSVSMDGDTAKIEYSEMPVVEDATLFVAIAEDGLGSTVDAGENAGSTLSHVSVVRKLVASSRVPNGEKTGKTEVKLTAEDGWNREKLRVVVFIQENRSRMVRGVARTDFPAGSQK